MPLHYFTLALMAVATLGNPVDLGRAGNFAILSKSGISTVPASAITGNIGTSPIAAHAITGFSQSLDEATKAFSTSGQVTGKVYAADYTEPTPTDLTTAISNMEVAYTEAAGRAPGPTSTGPKVNVFDGLISGQTFTPGVYKWSTNVDFSSDIYLTSDVNVPDGLFIFQIANNLIVGSGAKVILKGDIKAANIVWQVAGYVEAGTTSHMEGIILGATSVALKTGSSINGRILSLTAVTLDSATVTQPVA